MFIDRFRAWAISGWRMILGLRHLVGAMRIAKQRYLNDRINEDITHSNARRVLALLESEEPVRIEFGAGANRGIPGWVYADSMSGCDLQLDVRQPLPLPNGVVNDIYSSHLLEHLSYWELRSFLSECIRVLAAGGKFSAAVPNARLYVDAYVNRTSMDLSTWFGYGPAYNFHSHIDYVNYIAYMDGHHRLMFDEHNIIAILSSAGFYEPSLREFDPGIDVESRQFESIYVDAIVPSRALG